MPGERKQSRSAAVPSLHGTGFPRPGPAVGRRTVLPNRPANDNVPSWRAGIGVPLLIGFAALTAAALLAVALG